MSTLKVFRTSLLLIAVSFAACAFFESNGGDDGPGLCTKAEDCKAGEGCNLVTQRCQPKGNARENQLIVDYQCPVLRGSPVGTEPGPAYASLRFGGKVIDSGFGCFARINSAGTLDLTLASTTDDETVLSLDVWDAANAGSPASIPGTAIAFYDRKDSSDRLLPVAVASGGSISFSGAIATAARIDGKADITLKPALARNQACTAVDPQLWDCGSSGSGRMCVDETTDPSGVATCRDMCMDDLPCTGADEQCVPLYGSVTFCIPSELLEKPCTQQSDCEEDEACVETIAGQGAKCYPRCDPDAAPSCALGSLCAGLEMGGGACLHDPCDALSCGSGEACERSSAAAASCVIAGAIVGTFSAQISNPENPLYGNAVASGSTPPIGAWTAGGPVYADLFTAGSGKQYVRVIVFGPDVEARRDLMFLVPIAKAQPDLALNVAWDAFGAIGVLGEEAEAQAISGLMTFTEVGASMGHAVNGTFAIYMRAATP